MCGITGLFLEQTKDIVSEKVVNMTRSLRHRGPDGFGVECFELRGGFLGLGHRRLSIRDLSDSGHQPMFHPETKNWVVFNGEIYNYSYLRKELEEEGAIFRSHCDTEVILHAYAKWGSDCFARLSGMFAIGLYDQKQQRLILARDPMGIKPLYYSQGSWGVVFASELRALMESRVVGRNIDRRALASFLAYGAVAQPLTMFSSARQIEPGSQMIIDLSSPPYSFNKPVFFWNYPKPSEPVDRPYGDIIEELREKLILSVNRHLVSDVPVGLFLSGGIDSTVLATLSSAKFPGCMDAFTVGFSNNQELDEGPIAAEVAKELGVKHHLVSLSESDVLNHVDKFLSVLDQPTMDGLNTYVISKAVSSYGFKVALSGLGGDELFGGYPSFHQIPRLTHWLKMAYVLPPRVRSQIANFLYIHKSKAQRYKAQEFALTIPSVKNLYFRRRRLFSDNELSSFGLFWANLNLDMNYMPVESLSDIDLNDRDPESAISLLESRFYMGNTLLRDADVFGMSNGLEIRVPLLDGLLLDFVHALPGNLRRPRGQQNKPLLVDSMADKLNPLISSLPKKGFRLPQAAWMAGPLRERFEYFLDVVSSSGLVEKTQVNRVWKDFIDDQNGPNWSRAWTLGVLGAWLNNNADWIETYKS
jgi:asparagine synthase (glutamine-hydrolysing)